MRKTLLSLAIFLAAGCAAGAASSGSDQATLPAAPSQPVLSLTRTPCTGVCPAYRIELDSAGNGTFQAQGDVTPTPFLVSRHRLEAIRNLFDSLGFFEISPHVAEDQSAADSPTARLMARRGSRAHTVVNGDPYAAEGPPFRPDSLIPPDLKVLTRLAAELDSVAGVYQWLRAGRPLRHGP